MRTPGAKKEVTHDRIVDAAARAIRRSGFHGTGVADIMKAAGLTHGGFYAHFESRDALLLEAMDRAGRDGHAALLESIDKRVAKGESRFSAFVNAYLHDAQLDNLECGCLIAALSSEMPRQDETLRAQAAHRIARFMERVRDALPASVDPALADVIAATMVGALQFARTMPTKTGKALLAQTRHALLAQYDPSSSHR